MPCIPCYQKWQAFRSEYVYFQSYKLYHFFILCTHNTKNFILKIRMLVGHIIDYVQICFHNLFKYFKKINN
jgi:hypothetical protein